MIITVDGLAASGKGTLARKLGERYKLPVLDTGALWRILACELTVRGFSPDNEPHALYSGAHRIIDDGLNLELASSDFIRTEDVGNFASVVSGFPRLRTRIDDVQKDWLVDNKQSGILDGRETGVSIAPHADFKFFLFATTIARAGRRAAQLGQTTSESIGEVQKSITERDQREITRHTAPVRPAFGATLIDTTYRSARAVFEHAIDTIEDHKAWDKRLLQAMAL